MKRLPDGSYYQPEIRETRIIVKENSRYVLITIDDAPHDDQELLIEFSSLEAIAKALAKIATDLKQKGVLDA